MRESKKEEARFVDSKKDIAYMVNVYATHFGLPVRMTEFTAEKDVRFIVGELRTMTGKRMPAAKSNAGKTEYIPASTRWLCVQINEAWGL